MSDAENVESVPETPDVVSDADVVEAGQQDGANSIEEQIYEKFLLKVNGEERETVYKTKEDLVRDLQKAVAADQKFQEAAGLRQKYEPLVNKLRKPDTLIDALTELGYDSNTLDQLAESRLVKRLEEEALDPRDRELRKVSKQLEEYRQKEQQAAQQAEVDRWNSDIISALEKSGVPQSPGMINKVIDTLMYAYNNGLQITAEDAVPYAKKMYQQELLNGVSAEQLMSLLDDDGLKILNKAFRSAQKKVNNSPVAVGAPTPSRAPAKQQEKVTISDIDAWVARKLGG